MKNLRLLIIIVGVTALGISVFLIKSQPLHNELKNYFNGEYRIIENGMTVINNQAFFVSKSCNSNCYNEIIRFHDVTFIMQSNSLTNPGGFETITTSFLDGDNETLTLASRGSSLTVFTTHVHPQAGVTLNVNGTFNFLVSTD